MARILLLSDIHSNLAALDTVLKHAGSVEAVWCLGDVVGYGPRPNECVERLRALQAASLAGNHDLAVLGRLDQDTFTANASRAVTWTQRVLLPGNREWLEGLNPSEVRGPQNVTLVHGSPRQPVWEYILSAATAEENLPYFDAPVCFYGHTHIPLLFYRNLRGTTVPVRLPLSEPLELEAFGKCLLNPGSVGQPRDRDPRASYAIFDDAARTVTLHRVPYSIAETQAAMREVGLPQALIERLDRGI